MNLTALLKVGPRWLLGMELGREGGGVLACLPFSVMPMSKCTEYTGGRQEQGTSSQEGDSPTQTVDIGFGKWTPSTDGFGAWVKDLALPLSCRILM